MRVFFDSNTLLYSAGSDLAKAKRSDVLLARGGWVSVQVLNEIASVSQRKMHHDWRQTHDLLTLVRTLTQVTDLSVELHERGLELAERYLLSVYDAMIVAAALETGCDTLYSEDMHHGLVVDGRLTIVNPFA